MIETLLQNLDTLLVYVFAGCALLSAALMLVLRQPMRVALALISTMVFLGGIYGLLGVHFIAAFQVLIYVGAVMVFMVYVIMLLDIRDPTVAHRFSHLVVPGLLFAALLVEALGFAVWEAPSTLPVGRGGTPFGISEFSIAFLTEYWLHFELTSVLLVVAVVAALAVIKVNRRENG